MKIQNDNLGRALLTVLTDDGRVLWKAAHLTPALSREIGLDEWLPPGSVLGDDVDVLRAELRERRAATAETAAALAGLRDKYRREDDAQTLAAADALRTGTPSQGNHTSPADRDAAISAAQNEHDAATLADYQAQDAALAFVIRNAPRWDDTRAELDRAAAEGMAEAERIMAEARAVDQAGASLALWLERNASAEQLGLARGWTALKHAKRREDLDLATVDAALEPDHAEEWVNA